MVITYIMVIIDILMNMDIIPQRLLISWGRNCGDNRFPDDYGYTPSGSHDKDGRHAHIW